MSRRDTRTDPFPGPQDQGVQGGAGHRCAWKGCANAGEYRAPMNRALNAYYLFCLDHVRAYNAQWNYHAGMKPGDIEADIRRTYTWDRPTWKLGSLGAGLRGGRSKAHDPFGFAEGTDFDSERRQKAGTETAGHRADPEHGRALKTLNLTEPLTLDALKRRYKTLVKKHHPDANGGSKEAEKRMQAINAAYHVLRTSLMSASAT